MIEEKEREKNGLAPETKKRVGIIVQARQGSTRLPGKALVEVNGRPLLWYLMARLSRLIDEGSAQLLVLAVPDTPQDNALCRSVESWRLPFKTFRGDEQDVLERFMAAAQYHHLDVIARVTGDNPLTSLKGLRGVITMVAEGGYDYAKCAGFPLGTGSEAFTFSALRKAWREAEAPPAREHVTPYMYHRPDSFKLGEFPVPEEMVIPGFSPRLTIDTADDLRLFQMILERWTKDHARGEERLMEAQDAVAILREEKGLMGINAKVRQKRLGE